MPPATLPYGEQRRLEIARAMCTDPVLLCLDEPAAGLNPREIAELNELLRLIRDEHGISILLIEHDMSVVMGISDHVVVLDYGVKIADGTPAADPQRSEGDRAPISASRTTRSRRSRRRSGYDRAAARRSAASRPSTATSRRCKGVDLDVDEGEIVTLIGANGAGKSTLMMTIFGNPRAREGAIMFDGHDITQLPTHEIARLRHRAGAGGPAHLPAHDGAREPADGRDGRRPGAFRRGPRARLHAVPAAERAPATSAAARCRAASSRCWRSAAR